MGKVTFDGINKLILVNYGETELDVKMDLYSEWKQWVLQLDNAKFEQAMVSIGGDTISSGRYLGTTTFLENNWKIKPYSWNHILTINGNLYTRDGSSPFIPCDGDFNVTINLSTSNLIDAIATNGSTVDTSSIANAVWNQLLSQIITEGSIGKLIQTLEKKIDDTEAIVMTLD